MKKLICILTLVILVGGCTNPSYFRQNLQFTPRGWAKIAVLPFSGDVRFTQEATDTFNLHLLEQNGFILIEPVTIEYALNKIAVASNSENAISILQAQQIGEIVKADAVFIGNVTSYTNGFSMNGFSTVKLIDTKTGTIIAASHKPSGLLMAYSEHQCAVKAVERTAKDMLKALKGLCIKNIAKPAVSPLELFNKNEKML